MIPPLAAAATTVLHTRTEYTYSVLRAATADIISHHGLTHVDNRSVYLLGTRLVDRVFGGPSARLLRVPSGH